jgi:hypothetical protein
MVFRIPEHPEQFNYRWISAARVDEADDRSYGGLNTLRVAERSLCWFG